MKNKDMSFKLDPKVKAKWVKALRSGKFRQNTLGHLKLQMGPKGDAEYCCLGVARELKLASKCNNGDEFVLRKFLPLQIQEELARLNDWGVPFEVIAGIIQELL
jgi:hypothetical protein